MARHSISVEVFRKVVSGHCGNGRSYALILGILGDYPAMPYNGPIILRYSLGIIGQPLLEEIFPAILTVADSCKLFRGSEKNQSGYHVEY
jgi:hypothetical protein